jgi:hypothetical protein
MVVPADDFSGLVNSAWKRGDKRGLVHSTDDGIADKSLIKNGIGIAYHNGSKKKKIRLIVHTATVIGGYSMPELWAPTSKNISKLLDNMEQHIEDYFDSAYGLNDFALSRVDIVADIDVGNRANATEYLKVLHSIGRVKCFTPFKYGKSSGVAKESFFGLVGNTNGTEFRAYNQKDAPKILRVEVRLTTKDAINAYSSGKYALASDRISTLAQSSAGIFMTVFRHIVPLGHHYKKQSAEKLVMDGVKDKPLQRRMLRLLALVPEKKSLHLAQKALNVRDIKSVMAAFAEIGVSPVTLSKRCKRKELASIYSYVE